MSLMFWIALATIALWVLFSGGTPALKFIVYRALFVAFAFAAVIGVLVVHDHYGLGPAVLTAMAVATVWFVLIGPMVSMPLYFRKNPKKLENI